jgi:hypothetical protein
MEEAVEKAQGGDSGITASTVLFGDVKITGEGLEQSGPFVFWEMMLSGMLKGLWVFSGEIYTLFTHPQKRG